jgi:hypothetical protein
MKLKHVKQQRKESKSKKIVYVEKKAYKFIKKRIRNDYAVYQNQRKFILVIQSFALMLPYA